MKQVLFSLCLLSLASCHTGTPKQAGAAPADTPGVHRLGTATQITLGTPVMERSLAFWKSLGFKEVSNTPSGIQLSDESVLIMLQPAKKSYLRLTYFNAQAGALVAELEKAGIHFITKNESTGQLTRSIFMGADSLPVSLVNLAASDIYKPKGKSLGQLSAGEMKDSLNFPNRVCGIFGELSIAVKDLKSSLTYWKQFGFTGAVNKDPYPWATVSDGSAILGLHQTTDFTHPTLTFCAPFMKSSIALLKKSGLTLKEFMGPGNVVTVSPEGIHVFLFSL